MTAVAAVAAVVVLVVLGTVVLFRRRVRVWRRFARDVGLAFELDASDQPRVAGELDGRPVELAVVPESSDRGWFAVEPIELSVGALAEAPDGFEVTPRTALDPVVGVEDVETGDAAFDRLARAVGDRPEQVREFLTAPRRAALAALFESAPPDLAGMRGAVVFMRRRRGLSRRPVLDRDLARLTEAARGIDGGSA